MGGGSGGGGYVCIRSRLPVGGSTVWEGVNSFDITELMDPSEMVKNGKSLCLKNNRVFHRDSIVNITRTIKRTEGVISQRLFLHERNGNLRGLVHSHDRE